MREIILKRAEMRELSENARESREMRETWQVCLRPSLFTLWLSLWFVADIVSGRHCIGLGPVFVCPSNKPKLSQVAHNVFQFSMLYIETTAIDYVGHS